MAQLITGILGSAFTIALTVAYPVPMIGLAALLMLAACVVLWLRARREVDALREFLEAAG